MTQFRLPLCAVALIGLLAACSNGRGSVEEAPGQAPPPGTSSFTIGGSVTGLLGSGLVLQNNGADDLSVSADGPFEFATALSDGANYAVTVLTQPSNPAQVCTVANGNGSVAALNVSNVAVTCAAATGQTYFVGGTVSGLLGSGLVLRNNGTDDLAIQSDGAFSFETPLPTNATYQVTVAVQPSNPEQTCSVVSGEGTIGTADVTTIQVACSSTSYTLGGTVSGLLGSGLQLQNGGETLAIAADGAFVFPTRLADGSPYNVTVRQQPSSPPQTCTISGGSGTITQADVNNVAVSCSTGNFSVGGSVSGLIGRGLVLDLNGAESRPIPVNGVYTFATALPVGSTYTVSVRTQPSEPSQTCTVTNGTGAITVGNVTDVDVACVTNTFAIGGEVSGLAGTGLVLSNGGETLPIVSDGSFTFANRLASGSAYDVRVQTLPSGPNQICTVENGTGIVGSSDVRNVRVTCNLATYSVGGSVSGLLGSGLELENNDEDVIEIQSDTTFVFPAELADGSQYEVTVRSQPREPTQSCTVANGSGVIAGADVSDVAVSCTTSTFAIGGRVRGLVGSGLVVRNVNVEDLPIAEDGRFTFTTAIASGSPYEIVVASQPINPRQECTIENGTGIVGDDNIDNVRIECVQIEFQVRGRVSGLEGAGLVLLNNGVDSLAIAADGEFVFPQSLPNGTPYEVTTSSQPINPTQVCTVRNGTGTIDGRDANDVRIDCETARFTVGGTVLGLIGIGLRIQNNGRDRMAIFSNGTFTFSDPIESGATYEVTIERHPFFPAQTCTVTNGSGTVTTGNVTTVSIACN